MVNKSYTQLTALDGNVIGKNGMRVVVLLTDKCLIRIEAMLKQHILLMS